MNQSRRVMQQHAASHCNTPQHTTAHHNTPQHTGTHCDFRPKLSTINPKSRTLNPLPRDTHRGDAIEQHLSIVHGNTLHHTASRCNTLHHTTTHYNTLTSLFQAHRGDAMEEHLSAVGAAGRGGEGGKRGGILRGGASEDSNAKKSAAV